MDADTGEYVAVRATPDGQHYAVDEDYNLVRIKGKAKGAVAKAAGSGAASSAPAHPSIDIAHAGLGGKVLPMLIPAIGSLVGGTDSLVGTGGLSAIVGALLPLIVGFFKKPAVAA